MFLQCDRVQKKANPYAKLLYQAICPLFYVILLPANEGCVMVPDTPVKRFRLVTFKWRIEVTWGAKAWAITPAYKCLIPEPASQEWRFPLLFLTAFTQLSSGSDPSHSVMEQTTECLKFSEYLIFNYLTFLATCMACGILVLQPGELCPLC